MDHSSRIAQLFINMDLIYPYNGLDLYDLQEIIQQIDEENTTIISIFDNHDYLGIRILNPKFKKLPEANIIPTVHVTQLDGSFVVPTLELPWETVPSMTIPETSKIDLEHVSNTPGKIIPLPSYTPTECKHTFINPYNKHSYTPVCIYCGEKK